jgi:hypothetical protein
MTIFCEYLTADLILSSTELLKKKSMGFRRRFRGELAVNCEFELTDGHRETFRAKLCRGSQEETPDPWWRSPS